MAATLGAAVRADQWRCSCWRKHHILGVQQPNGGAGRACIIRRHRFHKGRYDITMVMAKARPLLSALTMAARPDTGVAALTLILSSHLCTRASLFRKQHKQSPAASLSMLPTFDTGWAVRPAAMMSSVQSPY